MPDVSSVHVDQALTNVSVGYRPNSYISEEIFPPVTVQRQSDKYYKVDEKREAMRLSDTSRAPGAEANEVDFDLSTDTYFCEDHALEGIIPDEERANADPAVQADINRAELITDKILLGKEVGLVTLLEAGLATEGTNLTTLDAGKEWSNYSTGDPVADVQGAIAKHIATSKGQVPNGMVLPYEVFLKMKDHPDIIDRVKYGGSTGNAGVVNAETLAQVFGIDRLWVPRSFKNTAKQGAAASMSAVWGENDVVLCYIPAAPGLRTQALGYSFRWNVGGGSVDGMLVERWREAKRHGDMISVRYYYDQKVVDSGCAHRIANTLG